MKKPFHLKADAEIASVYFRAEFGSGSIDLSTAVLPAELHAGWDAILAWFGSNAARPGDTPTGKYAIDIEVGSSTQTNADQTRTQTLFPVFRASVSVQTSGGLVGERAAVSTDMPEELRAGLFALWGFVEQALDLDSMFGTRELEPEVNPTPEP